MTDADIKQATVETLRALRDALAEDVAPRLTCNEAEAVAYLLDLLGGDAPYDRATFLAWHAEGDDDEEDRHYRGS